MATGDYPDGADGSAVMNGSHIASPTVSAPAPALTKEVDDVLHSDVGWLFE